MCLHPNRSLTVAALWCWFSRHLGWADGHLGAGVLVAGHGCALAVDDVVDGALKLVRIPDVNRAAVAGPTSCSAECSAGVGLELRHDRFGFCRRSDDDVDVGAADMGRVERPRLVFADGLN